MTRANYDKMTSGEVWGRMFANSRPFKLCSQRIPFAFVIVPCDTLFLRHPALRPFGGILINIVRKNTRRFTKSPSLVLIRLVFTEIQQFQNLKTNKEMYGHPDAVSVSVRMAIHFFVNFGNKWLYLAYYWVYLHQTKGFC